MGLEDMEHTDTPTTGDYDLEEARDAVADMARGVQSERIGMPFAVDRHQLGDVFHAKHGGARRKTKSDISSMVLSQNLPVRHTHQRQRRMSSSDVLTKFGTAPILFYDDLKLADSIASYGTRRERLASGISEEDFAAKLGEKEDYESSFAFNAEGLSSTEADALLKKYGRNELPESVDPLWLVFLQQFWAPMPTMIWVSFAVCLLPHPCDTTSAPWIAHMLALPSLTGLVSEYP
jgi:magnesium-transporting ATPase (P-type)